MEIKICGLTNPREADYLNEAGADYAGFVLYEKSRRNVTLEQAAAVRARLAPGIKSVAVTVSPDAALARRVFEAGFDILQIHGDLSGEVLSAASIPVWYAFNIAGQEELLEKRQFFQELPQELSGRITAIVVDGADYGGGKTFGWDRANALDAGGRQGRAELLRGRSFVLAGGLTPENAAQGIRLFHPDIVDVSSGVERDGGAGKDRDKIMRFVKAVRRCQENADESI